jgi:RNA polymerase sigma factor (sigma-70 family)
MRASRIIFLVDDDATVCHALSVFLEASGYHVRTYHSAEVFLEKAECTMEGIILLDIRMAKMSGLELQTELTRRGVILPIIFMTGHGDVQMSVQAIKNGAVDFLEKPFSNENLLKSIDEAFSRADNSIKQYRRTEEIRKRHATLSEREQEVMQHVVAGMSNKDIAELLGLSNRTIEVHRHNLMKKMEAESLVDLVHQYSVCRMDGM